MTNTRDFVLIGEDVAGNPVKLETFRLADTPEEFETRLERPRAFANEVGAGLEEYLCRSLSHRARVVELRLLYFLLRLIFACTVPIVAQGALAKARSKLNELNKAGLVCGKDGKFRSPSGKPPRPCKPKIPKDG